MDERTAAQIWQQIENTSCRDLKRDLVRKALEYAHIRANWSLLDFEERRARDRGRTLAHDALIDACNILSRNMARTGEDNGWRAVMGEDRKDIGDFACHLHALLGVRMR